MRIRAYGACAHARIRRVRAGVAEHLQPALVYSALVRSRLLSSALVRLAPSAHSNPLAPRLAPLACALSLCVRARAQMSRHTYNRECARECAARAAREAGTAALVGQGGSSEALAATGVDTSGAGGHRRGH
jgi:hypothetical protein